MAQTTGPVQIATAERRQFILTLRKTGATYQRIAELTIEQFGEAYLPKGFDSLYACKDVMRELEHLRKIITEDTIAIRDLEMQRLDALYVVAYRQAIGGNLNAIDRCLRIQERRAKYVQSLEVAEVFEVTGKDGTPIITEIVIARPEKDNGRPDEDRPDNGK